jgi:hypothetical protein
LSTVPSGSISLKTIAERAAIWTFWNHFPMSTIARYFSGFAFTAGSRSLRSPLTVWSTEMVSLRTSVWSSLIERFW